MENQSDGSYKKSCIHDFPKIQTHLLHYHIGATFRLLLWNGGRAYTLRLFQPFAYVHSLEKCKRAKSYYSCLTRRNPRKLYWKLAVVLYRMAFLNLATVPNHGFILTDAERPQTIPTQSVGTRAFLNCPCLFNTTSNCLSFRKIKLDIIEKL